MRVRPDRDTFEREAEGFALAPVWTELLADVSTPVGVFPALAGDGSGLLLESVERSERWGRYSFVAGDPAAIVVLDRDGLRVQDATDRLSLETPSSGDARADLVALARSLRAPRVDGLPSLTGGLMGFLSYEAAALLDGHPFPDGDTMGPPIALMLVDRAVVFDHWRQRMLLVAHVPPGRLRRGRGRVEGARRAAVVPERPRARPVARAGGGVRRLARRAQHAGRPLPRDRSDDEGAHRGGRHLPGCPLAAGRLRVLGRRVPRLPAPPRHEPGSVHVLRADARPRARRLVAGAAGPSRGADRDEPPDRRDAPTRGDRAPRPSATSTSSSPTPRSAPSTRCSSTWPATTWAACARPGRSGRASSCRSNASRRSCTSSARSRASSPRARILWTRSPSRSPREP